MIEKLLVSFPRTHMALIVLFIYFYFDKDYKITDKIPFIKNKRKIKAWCILIMFFVGTAVISGLLETLNIPRIILNTLNGMLIGMGASILSRGAQYIKQ